MKILILIEVTSIGGHVISAFTTGKELRKRGHEVSQETREKIRKATKEFNRKNGIGIKHGTTTGYSWYGCRCKLCKAARSEYRKAHWKKHRR